MALGAKRALDIMLGSVLATLALPLILALALAMAATLRAWPFFCQQRVGRHGLGFTILKLRTLPPSAPRYTNKYALDRLTVPRLCRILRASHLDELPQLFLVPLGRMSLVGPRPEMPNLHAGLPSRFAAVRVTVRPGCTGVWQISEARARLIGEDPEFDRVYIRSQSLGLDLWILMKTALVLTRLSPPLALADLPQRWVRGTASDRDVATGMRRA